MRDINSLVTTNFNENVAYLETYHPLVFKNIVALESAIEHKHYEEKYELIYENNRFDVLEKSTKNMLYAGESQKYTEAVSKSVNDKIDNNVFETFHKRTISSSELQAIEEKEPFIDHLGGFAPIIYYIQEHKSNAQDRTNMEKFIFFGAGLGLHISAIHEKIASKIYLIIEDDLELFRLSLFTTNYKDIAQKSKLIFSVFEDEHNFSITATKFLTQEYQYNHYIKYFHMLSHTEDKQLQLHQLITSQPHLTFFYNTMLQHYTRPLEYLLKNYKFLTNKISLNNKHLRNKPFLLLAAGPSLEKNRLWLKENYQSYVIVAVAATLSFLESENISPDIIIQLDGHLESIEHFKKLKSFDFLQESIYIFADKVPSIIIDMLPEKQLFFFEHASKYKKNSLRPTAFCVGSVSLELLLLLKVKEIYLLGLDLAIDSKTGLTHSSSHINPRVINPQTQMQESDILEYKTSLKEIVGNQEQTVLTTQHFYESIEIINHLLKSIKLPEQTIINLGSGAKFINTSAKECKDIHFTTPIEKSQIRAQIYKECIKNTSNSLSTSELASLKQKRSHARELKLMIEKHLTLNLSSNEGYLKEIRKVALMVSEEENITKYELSRIIDTYLRYILPYIFDYLNTTTGSEDFLTIRELLSNHLIKIVDFYLLDLAEVGE